MGGKLSIDMREYLVGTFQKKLKELRNEKNWNQRDVAEKLSMSHGSYAEYETGAEPRFVNLVKIANLYNVTVDFLLGLEN